MKREKGGENPATGPKRPEKEGGMPSVGKCCLWKKQAKVALHT
jgi:hypothetical protein